MLWHTGHIHFRVVAASGQGWPASVAADLRFGDGRVPRFLGFLLLAIRARRRRVGFQSRTTRQPGSLHQHVRTGRRAHTRRHDRRALQPGIQRTGHRNRLCARVVGRVLCRQVVSDAVEQLRPRYHVRIVLRVLRVGYHVRVLPGAGDEEQVSAGNPGGARWQEESRPDARPVGIIGCQRLEHFQPKTRLTGSCAYNHT